MTFNFLTDRGKQSDSEEAHYRLRWSDELMTELQPYSATRRGGGRAETKLLLIAANLAAGPELGPRNCAKGLPLGGPWSR